MTSFRTNWALRLYVPGWRSTKDCMYLTWRSRQKRGQRFQIFGSVIGFVRSHLWQKARESNPSSGFLLLGLGRRHPRGLKRLGWPALHGRPPSTKRAERPVASARRESSGSGESAFKPKKETLKK